MLAPPTLDELERRNDSQGSRTACRGLEFPGIGRGIYYSLNERNPGYDGRIAERRAEYDLRSNRCSIQEYDEIIYSYSRYQALTDGVLVDVSRMAAEANFRYPTAITADLHARITPNEREKALAQSYEGRLWDILFMTFTTVLRQGTADQASYEVGLFEAEADPAHHTRQSTLKLWIVVGPGDQGEPAITIGFPENF